MISFREMTDTAYVDTPTSSSAFAEEVKVLFSNEGPLSKFPDFEWRPQQQQMAVAIAKNLAENNHLIVEAGTGVGKSLAYLIPAVLFAKRERRKAIITTHTINLQEQLIEKDIPLVKQVLDLPFEAALFKGRQNYICPVRLQRAIAQATNLFTSEQLAELQSIRQWSHETQDGTLSDYPHPITAEIWSEICSESHACTPRTCGENSRCFYQQARKRAQKADVLVLNHSLFFTLLAGMASEEPDGEGFLFPNDFVIFDEAHHIESAAAKIAGLSISQYGLRITLHRLYNPRTKKGLFTLMGSSEGQEETKLALKECTDFFESLGNACKFEKGREFRVRESGIADASRLCEGLERMGKTIQNLLDHSEDESSQAELRDSRRRLLEVRRNLIDFLALYQDDYVYWVEQSGKTSSWLNLNACPVDGANVLRRTLFREGVCSTLTSATLSIGRPDLSYFRQRVGAEEVDALSVGSPFDYERQMTLHVVRKMPDPLHADYEEALEKWIRHFVMESDGHAFVLFTSYRTMRNLGERLESTFSKKGWPLLVQGSGISRRQMVQEFREAESAVLFGTDSFWSGVDIPGKSLTNVIITRLPFMQPGQPLIEAKLEKIIEDGGDPFRDYSLPEAILKLRQGVGRLIRTQKDRGIVVILDSRIVNKNYGKSFLNALPSCPVKYH